MNNSKSLISKGLIRIGFSIFLMFLGPVLTSIGFRALNDGIYFWFIIGIILSLTAIILGFIGVKTILKGIFDNGN